MKTKGTLSVGPNATENEDDYYPGRQSPHGRHHYHESPPAFRTAVHRFVPSPDTKRPPVVETAHRETPLDRPGIRVEASDRVYVVEPTGALRRAAPRREKHRPPVPFAAKVQKVVSAARIEAAIEQAEQRRLHRKLKKAQERHERLENVLARADAALARTREAGR